MGRGMDEVYSSTRRVFRGASPKALKYDDSVATLFGTPCERLVGQRLDEKSNPCPISIKPLSNAASVKWAKKVKANPGFLPGSEWAPLT